MAGFGQAGYVRGMDSQMTLAEVLRRLRKIELVEDDDSPATICAQRPWSPASEALLAKAPPDGLTTPFGGCDYFLEASLVQDFFREWPESFEDGCRRIIQYAENDA